MPWQTLRVTGKPGVSRVSLDPPVNPAGPRRAARGDGFGLAPIHAGASVVLHESPGGRALARVGSRTDFGSPRVLAVVERRGPWLAVATEVRRDGRAAWVHERSPGLRSARTGFVLRADLSQRTVELRHEGKLVKRLSVAIGRPGSETPVGRFAVTDKLNGRRFNGYYGCCIIALSGLQPKTPGGWRGGNRLAIHGTVSPGTIGGAASAGCLRAAAADMRVLMRRVPLVTPVLIRP